MMFLMKLLFKTKNYKISILYVIEFISIKQSVLIKKLKLKKAFDVFDEIIFQDKEIARLGMVLDQTNSTKTRKLLKLLG